MSSTRKARSSKICPDRNHAEPRPRQGARFFHARPSRRPRLAPPHRAGQSRRPAPVFLMPRSRTFSFAGRGPAALPPGQRRAPGRGRHPGGRDMTPRMVLEGIYTPLITPFQADGSFDLDALAELIERLIAAGVHGLISG
ncbi:dihydrodipicolinate synthase family protein, partial [Paracoccus yeei]|uniref:dihydrodipicolinate synthase family protein n=1 Tax=Paracoccus yeei TaxID=147645 RepID=UPI0036F3D6F7